MGAPRSTPLANSNPISSSLISCCLNLDGFEVARILRKEMTTPILMLTARDDEIDRVVGLEVGADDYLTKPFSMRELMARVKAQLRRSRLLREESANSVTAQSNRKN